MSLETPTLRDMLPPSRIALWEHFFFTRLSGANSLESMGEDLLHQFASQYLDDCVMAISQPRGEALATCGSRSLSLRIRALETDITIAPTYLNLRVPANDRAHREIYLLAGHCAGTGYGYIFGWTSWEEMMSRPIQPELRYPARSMPLMDLHAMQSLAEFLG
jgi:hypothetical protein